MLIDADELRKWIGAQRFVHPDDNNRFVYSDDLLAELDRLEREAQGGGKMNDRDYWEECLSISFDECGISATPEQLKSVAADVSTSHENYRLAFHQPPSSDRVLAIEREWKQKYDALQREMDKQDDNARKALKEAFNIRDDADVTYNEYGNVFVHDGRTTQIQ